MRPRAVCVTGGHKSSVSLPPPGPCKCRRIQSSSTRMPHSLKLEDLIIHLVLTCLFPGFDAFCIWPFFSSRDLKNNNNYVHSQIHPKCFIQKFSKAVISLSRCEKAFTKSSDGWLLSPCSPTWQNWACCSTKDPVAHCLIYSTDDMQSVRKELI